MGKEREKATFSGETGKERKKVTFKERKLGKEREKATFKGGNRKKKEQNSRQKKGRNYKTLTDTNLRASPQTPRTILIKSSSKK